MPRGEESIGLTLGTVGIGWFLLRRADPDMPSILPPGAALLIGYAGHRLEWNSA